MKRRLVAMALVVGCSAETDDPHAFGLSFEPIETTAPLGSATELRFVPGTEELLVLDKGGVVTHLVLDGDDARLLGTFAVPGVYADLDCGLISLAFDPDFATNRYLYLGMCLDITQSAIVRFTFDTADYGSIAASAVEIFRAGDVRADRPWHNIGAVGFEPSGVMWALLGDKTVPTNGQSTDDALGAVVRIVPSRDPAQGGHEPAPDNPWIDAEGRNPDVAAIGLRSPWRGAIDSRGRLWLGDVGAEAFEEIDVLDRLGMNFGWALHEGPCARDCEDIADPIASWSHDGDAHYIDEDDEVTASVSRAAWVGVEHRPTTDDPYDGRLAGRMLFGDFCLGFVRALELDATGTIASDVALGHLAHASAWDQGPGGYLYATTFGACETSEAGTPPIGRLWRALPTSRPP